MIADLPIQKKKRSGDENFLFSILIPSWNNLDYLRLCVESIRKNSSHRHQIIVHVNEGKDGTLEWVASQKDLDYIYSPENIGVCFALNGCRGIVAADYIVYLNDDMYVCPGWDAELDREIREIGHKFFFLSATVIEPTHTGNPCVLVMNYGRDPAGFLEEKLLKEYSSLPMHDWQGATWPPNVVHRDIWDLVGGYSIEFSPGFYSDPDFSMKLWMLNIRLFKGVSKSRVYHFGAKSTSRVKKNKGYYTFIAKWGMTSSTLTRYFLRSGTVYKGPLKAPELTGWLRVKNFFKQLESVLRKGRSPGSNKFI
ncbi:MAG TPA: glycosyltransferase [Puia sp.]|nr:glycosyltransferase [Puia sp.]